MMASLHSSRSHRLSEDMREKEAAAMHLENQPCSGISPDDREFLDNFSDEAKRKILKKVRKEKGILNEFEEPLIDSMYLDRCA